MRTIGFFGDSFCASNQPESWCVLLAKRLGAVINHWGVGGASVWSTFISFEKLKKQRTLPDVLIFCWTEPYRLYHAKLPLAKGAVPILGEDTNIYKAADMYYVYLQNYNKDEIAYTYALQWFDQHELKSIEKKHTILQTWSMKPFELSGRASDIHLQTGVFLDESMLEFAWGNEKPKSGFKFDINLSNHMTVEQNQQWADRVYEKIKNV
jgi:hypothetical protein